MYKNIVCWYGVPHTIILENGKQFHYDEFKEFYDNLKIKKVLSSVARPQANEQVEAVSKLVKHNLKTKLKDLKGRWADELPEVLWVYRPTARTMTRETPFSITYRYEVIVLVDIRAGSVRRENYNSKQNFILQ